MKTKTCIAVVANFENNTSVSHKSTCFSYFYD